MIPKRAVQAMASAGGRGGGTSERRRVGRKEGREGIPRQFLPVDLLFGGLSLYVGFGRLGVWGLGVWGFGGLGVWGDLFGRWFREFQSPDPAGGQGCHLGAPCHHLLSLYSNYIGGGGRRTVFCRGLRLYR